jgi:hypothetical protein
MGIQEYRIEPIDINDEVKKVVVGSVINVPKTKQILIIGFDTEYQRKDSKENEVLSYQFSCEILHSDETLRGHQWESIIIPTSHSIEDRLSIPDFISVAISEGIEKYPDIKIPRTIYLVAHFTRADIPAFSEFKEDKDKRTIRLDNLRNSFVNLTKNIQVDLKDSFSGSDIKLTVCIRDSMHLSPTGKNSLDDLGDIVGVKKVKLSEDKETAKNLIENMKTLLNDDWKLFRKYAIQDAVIAKEYIVQIIRIYQQQSNNFKLPATLTSIGVDILQKFWKEKGVDGFNIVGKEVVIERKWNNFYQREQKQTKTPYLKKVHYSSDFFIDGYHGGRNEQFWFGLLPKDDWFDYDLTSAYPSVMSMLGYPYWDELKIIEGSDDKGLKWWNDLLEKNSCVVEYIVADVIFKFPKEVKYPCLPVRTEGGLIYPYEGNSITHISEIKVAKELGCEIELVEARYVPSRRHKLDEENGEIRPFEDFVIDCLRRRNEKKKEGDDLGNYFWKELVNSTYGKTAQGLRERRVYDLTALDMKKLPPSKITNPIFASFITGFCRATLAEIMNKLHNNRDDLMICSVTTDGFLTNATIDEMTNATDGVCCRNYKAARKRLYKKSAWEGEDEPIYEIKHTAKQVIGWRTRGQATFIPDVLEGNEFIEKEDQRYVLAKAGISSPRGYNKQLQNDFIIELFFNRTPDTKITSTRLRGVKDMWNDGYDLTEYVVEKIASMEFDWKRRPTDPSEVEIVFKGVDINNLHLLFKTVPWDDVGQFHTTRMLWREYNSSKRHVLKSVGDFKQFSTFMESTLSMGKAGVYLRKKDGDLIKLRQQIAIAQRFRKAGTSELKPHALGMKEIFPTYKLRSHQLAQMLCKLGVECNKDDIDNGRRKARNQGSFIPHQVPRNDQTALILRKLKTEVFPDLEIDQFLTNEKPSFTLLG